MPTSLRRSEQVDPQPGERWLVVGQSGSGKTTLQSRLSSRLADLFDSPEYILDSKNDPLYDHPPSFYRFVESDEAPQIGLTPRQRELQRWQSSVYGWLGRYHLLKASTVRKALEGQTREQFERLIWRPTDDDQTEYERFLSGIHTRRKAAVINIDELANLVPSGPQSAPRSFRLLMKQGRAFGQTVIVGTQELAYMPRQIKGQITHLLRFRLRDSYDADIINKMVGVDFEEPKDRFGFYYTRLDRPCPVWYYSDYREFLGGYRS